MSFKGDLSTIGLAEVFQMISMSQKEGTLVVGDQESRKSIYFGPSGVKLLSTGRRKGMKLGDMLVRAGKISEGQLQDALENARIQKKLVGEILVENGYATEEDVATIVREQIEEEIYDLFLWKRADFEFVEGPPGDSLKDPEAPVTRLAFDVNGLLLEAVRRADEWSVINQKVPSLDSIFVFCSESDRAEEDKVAPDVFRRIYRLVDGQKSISDIVENCGVGKFEVCKSLCDLQERGRIRLLTVQEILEVAGKWISEGQRERAHKLYMAAAVHAPDDVKVISGTARFLEGEGLAREAAGHYVKAGRLHLDAGDLDRALDSLQRAAALNPDDADVKPAMFEVHAAAGNLAEGKALARELTAQALTGSSPDYPRARTLLDRIIKADPADLEFRILRAKVLHRTGPKKELQEELDTIQKNMPVDAKEAERYQRDLREILVIKTPTTAHPPASQVRAAAAPGGKKKKLVWLAVAAALLALAGAAVKFELDARAGVTTAIEKSQAMAARDDYDGARRPLDEFLASVYAYSPVQAGRARDQLAVVAGRELDWKNQSSQREADKRRKGLEQMRTLEETAETLRERDPAVALQKSRELRKLADEFQESDTLRRADELVARIEKYLSDALQLKVKADELERQGRVAEAATQIEKLISSFPNTEAARNALFPLEIVTRPVGVKVTQKNPNRVIGVTEAGKPLVHKMRQGEQVRLVFERPGYAKQEADVRHKTIGKLEIALTEKLDLFVRSVGLAVSADPVLAGPVLYVPNEGKLYALEVNPFKFLWMETLHGSMEGSPAVTKDFVVVGTTQRKLLAFARANGAAKKAWEVDLPDRPTASPAASADGSLVYLPTADRMLRAVSTRTGEEKWAREMGSYCALAPIPTDKGVVLGCTDGTIVCVRGPGADDEVWKVRTDGAVSGMTFAEGTIYATCADQSVYGIDAVRGLQLWRRVLPAGATGRPLRLDGTVLVGAKDGKVHFREAATGEPLASYETQGAIIGSIASFGSLALFTSEDGHLYAFDLAARALAWRYKAEGRIRTPPLMGDGKVYFVAGEKLYAIELN